MKRLTAIEENGNAFYPYCFREDTCFGAGESEKCLECDFAKKVCETLAAYENTGLTPSQILEMKERDTAKRYVKQKCQECIDLGRSIFERPKPLAEATMKRIANGIRKYVIENPYPYIVRSKEAVAFLIQYHGETKEGDSRGQLLTDPIKTIDTSNRYGLVTAFITKFYKSGIGQGREEPLHTITTSPGHFGLISAFLIKYYGSGGSCQGVDRPLDTITTKDRFGLVNVVLEIEGEQYILKDIFLRMLKPEELKLMQGFPRDYIINRDYNWKSYPIAKQVARIGNSVVPIMAKKLVEANCPYLKVGERVPNMEVDESGYQIRFA